jgi:hypothetical protein
MQRKKQAQKKEGKRKEKRGCFTKNEKERGLW